MCYLYTTGQIRTSNKISISFHIIKNTLPFGGFQNLHVDAAAGQTNLVDDIPHSQLDGFLPSVDT